MATPPTLDFDALLAPISGDDPAGRDLRSDYAPTAPYRVMKEARTLARRIERAIEQLDPDVKDVPDWRPILDHAPRTITTVSKDLEVAAWLTEALTRSKGFAGVRDGLRLCRELVERFWDGLHPRPDPEEPAEDGELSRRVSPLAGLNDGALVGPIEAISIVSSREHGPLGVSAYEQSSALEQVTDPREREIREKQGAVPLAAFQKAVANTSAEFYRTLLDDLGGAQNEFQALCRALDERCGSNGPPTANIADVLDRCQRRIRLLASDKLGLDTAPVDAPTASAAESGGGGGSRVDGPIRSRDEAFMVLRQVADFFRRTEPQSVLPYHLEECVRFGRMDLPALLSELINDAAVRDSLFKRIGIPPPASGE
ncbi:MAG: type VI secretion system protein TssA [Planctomycetia bacterium]|nr:MAG: type VI secretion system protein TssA [Planctomycetia bacterium]